MDAIVAIIIGIVSSFLSSILFLFAAHRIKPKIEVSPKISKYTDDKGRLVYVIKIINRGIRDAVDISLVLHLLRPIKNEEANETNTVSRSRRLQLKTNNLFKLAKRKKNEYFAFRVRCYKNIEEILKETKDSKLRFRLTARDSFTNSPILIEQTYGLDAIREGQFKTGNSFDIIESPTINNERLRKMMIKQILS